MAKQEDKKRERPQGAPQNTQFDRKGENEQPKDPDLYDPVGMAGKKAGIVEKIEQELAGAAEERGKERPEKKQKSDTSE